MNPRTLTILCCCALAVAACADDSSTTATTTNGPAPTATFARTTPAPTTADGPDTTSPDITTAPSGAPTVSDTTSPATTVATPTVPPPTLPDVSLENIDIDLDRVASVRDALELASRPGDSALYVVSRTGRIFSVRDGAVSDTPVLDLTVTTGGKGGEQGLLGLTFSGDGSKAYVYYTEAQRGDLTISEFAVGADGVFDAASERVLMVIEHDQYVNHNGGHITFGPDGLLYFATGDGGYAADPMRAAQDLNSMLGKIVRIDPTPSADLPYTIPEDNPFAGFDDTRPEIWAYGLRNPWRFSFDRVTGDLWIGDVGQQDFEEVDFVSAADGAGKGNNFGWSAFEGNMPYNVDQTAEDHTPPIYTYPHSDGNIVIIGGFVYRGSAIPDLYGTYVFGDNNSGRIWLLRPDGSGGALVQEAAKIPGLAAFGEGPDGELYAVSITEGRVYKFVPG